MPCCFQASPMLVYVQTCISSVTKDEEHSMCQIVLVSFLISLSLSLVTPLSGLALCLGLFVCSSNTCQAELQWNPSDLGGRCYWCLHCCSSWLTSWLPVLSGFSDLGTSLLLVTSQSEREPCETLHRQCMHGKHALLLLKWASECVRHGIFIFCFWYRTQQFPSRKPKQSPSLPW